MTVRIRDPGWKKVGTGIRDKHPGSATLVTATEFAMEKTYLGVHLVTLQVRKYLVITVKRHQFGNVL
jgi:hypothetical protein